MNKFFEAAKTAAFKAIPSSVSEENQYAKSFSSLLVLVVSADFEFEPEEFYQASAFIENDNVLKETGMGKRAVAFFKGYCESVKKVMKEGNLDFPSAQTEMILEVRDCPETYKGHLRLLIDNMCKIAEPKELAVLKRINL